MSETVDLAKYRALATAYQDEPTTYGLMAKRWLATIEHAETLAAEVERLDRIANAAHRYLSLQGTGTVGEGAALILLREAIASTRPAPTTQSLEAAVVAAAIAWSRGDPDGERRLNDAIVAYGAGEDTP